MKKGSLVFSSGQGGFNAGSKAVADAAAIASAQGWRLFEAPVPEKGSGFIKRLLAKSKGFSNILLCFVLSKEIFLQYPIYSEHYKVLITLLLKLHFRKCTILVHDLNPLRGEGSFKEECAFLKLADRIIVHNDAMMRSLAGAGLDAAKMRKLDLFDYLCEKPNRLERCRGTEICFAGNLSKSVFLRDLPSVISSCASINLYGSPSDNIRTGESVRYLGRFSPDDISGIHGSWGLVWDGDSCSGISGNTGEYLKLNSPHKASLYIAAGLPVIVSSESAIAPYVESKGLGICVSSLGELSERLSRISDEEYRRMTEAVDTEAAALKSGSHLAAALAN